VTGSSNIRDFASKGRAISQLGRPTSQELALAARRERGLLQGALILYVARKVSLAFAIRRKRTA
jgi:hypothetical protein